MNHDYSVNTTMLYVHYNSYFLGLNSLFLEGAWDLLGVWAAMSYPSPRHKLSYIAAGS